MAIDTPISSVAITSDNCGTKPGSPMLSFTSRTTRNTNTA